ncbi:MAG: hypothetical protein JNL74_11280 [Fibrobacteres bacterium]|nr:hypothetical protein [Fibrobacterota bacterium]
MKSLLLPKYRQGVFGRGREIAEQLGLKRKGDSFYCPTPDNHAHGGKRPCVLINNKTGNFRCLSTNCGVSGSLVKLAEILGHPDPWGKLVELTGIILTESEEKHLNNLRRKGVSF